eukprot:TRINITY_DN776466_c0_g1_i1.p1 TRINITY_DN776466_c0_g1~~TRINITY_DN776466_c0_g1_i1.p1  ORF type:complete len:194 (-),score=34.01 TRINITY_DN776466_c0_g1_i1:67-648(-)
MKVISPFLQKLHLDLDQCLLSVGDLHLLKCYFDTLDIHNSGNLDDVQVSSWLEKSTDLNLPQIFDIFSMFDIDDSGTIEFDEFYLLTAILIAIKDQSEKQFLWKHSRTCFELIDADGSSAISMDEFLQFGFLFNITEEAARRIFKDFDVDNSKELDYEEFKMFTLACIDQRKPVKETSKWNIISSMTERCNIQ